MVIKKKRDASTQHVHLTVQSSARAEYQDHRQPQRDNGISAPNMIPLKPVAEIVPWILHHPDDASCPPHPNTESSGAFHWRCS